MSPKRLNPESRVTPELLGDVSGLQQEFARVAYGKDRDGHGYELPDFTVGNPATVRHERFEVETDYVRDPATYELDSVPRVDWKPVPYGGLLSYASENSPVRQTIKPADWYYNEDEKDEGHPNLVIVSDQLSVAGLATILRINNLYRLQHEGWQSSPSYQLAQRRARKHAASYRRRIWNRYVCRSELESRQCSFA